MSTLCEEYKSQIFQLEQTNTELRTKLAEAERELRALREALTHCLNHLKSLALGGITHVAAPIEEAERVLKDSEKKMSNPGMQGLLDSIPSILKTASSSDSQARIRDLEQRLGHRAPCGSERQMTSEQALEKARKILKAAGLGGLARLRCDKQMAAALLEAYAEGLDNGNEAHARAERHALWAEAEKLRGGA